MTKEWQVWEVLLVWEREIVLAMAMVEEPVMVVVAVRLGQAGVEVRAP